jgi:hypothetical protein
MRELGVALDVGESEAKAREGVVGVPAGFGDVGAPWGNCVAARAESGEDAGERKDGAAAA